MVKIEKLTTNKGTSQIEGLEFNGSQHQICVITKVLLEYAFKDKEDRKLAELTIGSNLIDMSM